jgi:hypothetical protein
MGRRNGERNRIQRNKGEIGRANDMKSGKERIIEITGLPIFMGHVPVVI